MKQKLQLLAPVQILASGEKSVLGSFPSVPLQTVPASPATAPLSLSHALRIQSAHYWLQLGEADRALRELEALSSRAWLHPLAVKARLAALRAVGETNAVAHQ